MNDIISFFTNSNIHDYYLKNIKINYSEAIVDMDFIDLKNQLCSITICNIISVSMLHEEPWGKGTYVVSSDVDIQDGVANIEIQLNSGDKCIVKAFYEFM